MTLETELANQPQPPLLEVKNLKTYIYDSRHKKLLRIIDGVSFTVNPGEALGIFGESGSGKSSVAYSIMGLMPETPGIVDGEIWLKEQNLLNGLREISSIDTTKNGQFVIKKDTKALKNKLGYEARMKRIRGKEIALIPQGAKTALWPFGTIAQQIRRAYLLGSGQDRHADDFVGEILQMLKLGEMAHKYPHQLSGGACQRALIGMTLALDPMIIIADEPTTGLDTTLQVNIIGLLNHFKDGKIAHQSSPERVEKPRALIIISHDLKAIQKVADKIIVMYAGEIVESGGHHLIDHQKAMHPYTRQLLDIADISAHAPQHESSNADKLPFIKGEAPTLLNSPQGCRFYPRCPVRIDRCRTERPKLLAIDNGREHKVSCHVITNGGKTDTVASHS